jgi:preprotein translocase SecE subunit
MQKFITFLREAYFELKQVSWLTVPQMVASTWLVVILVMIMAAYLGAVDFVLSRVIGFFI